MFDPRALARLCTFLLCVCFTALAQDGSTVAIRGIVADASRARIVGARVTVVGVRTGVLRNASSDAVGAFIFDLLPPGEYWVRVEVPGMRTQEQVVRPRIGSSVDLMCLMTPTGVRQVVEVASRATIVDTLSSDVSHVIDEKTIDETPVSGRRFTELALLTPGVTPDPRGQTSGSNGDLSFGGIRGYHTSFLVDGADFNNGFFAQEQGRYRVPYQFSNDVVQEFRVTSNAYSPETGRAAGAVINVATKSGTNQIHGTGFYYLRDSSLAAAYPVSGMRPRGEQRQWGFTAGGPIKRNKMFVFMGWDEHDFSDPNVVRFLNGSGVVAPTVRDYDYLDQDLVTQQAALLSSLGGTYHAELKGTTRFIKIDDVLSPRNYLSLRLSSTRFTGDNNVFFDPGNPVTNDLESSNGVEQVSTDSALLTLTSTLNRRWTSHARVQFSRDLEQSFPNSEDARTKIYGVVDGFGRSSILPRRTREHRTHAAETLTYGGIRNTWKIGADALLSWDYNFFPAMFGGEYEFDTVRVNPWTFKPQPYGEHLTPLRAFAHDTPRYYFQSFGSAVSHPDSREYAAFIQDSIRVTDHFGFNIGVRYDLQQYSDRGLESNPVWPTSGEMPAPTNDFAPRVSLAYAFGNKAPLMLRAGYGWFYTRIPQIYEAAIATGNGLNQSFLFLDAAKNPDVFPQYPNPVVVCGVYATSCKPSASLAPYLTSEIYAFDPHFKTPVVQQGSVTLEKEVGRVSIATTYLYVHGEHLLRAVDANLPVPEMEQYPVYLEDGAALNVTLAEPSFGGWQTTRSMTCPYPPCINDVVRPIPQAGAVNVFQSAASSVYNGLTVSARKRMGRKLSFQLAYTYAKALDDGQDALVAGRPSTVQNPYSLQTDRGLSTTDQRQRLVLQSVLEPPKIHGDHPAFKFLLDGWKISQVTTVGSGRPVSGLISGDANADGNVGNDRLPGVGRNSFVGPDYASTEFRITKNFRLNARYRVELMAEGFNVLNRDNKKLTATDDGYSSTAAKFEQGAYTVGSTIYPGRYVLNPSFLQPDSSYNPRQIQFAAKLKF